MPLTKRYWGEDAVHFPESLSLSELHQLARERAVARTQPKEKESVAMETADEEEGLPMVTQTLQSVASAKVHHKLPDWITQPQLVSADIDSDSAPLDSVALPDVVAANLRAMGYSSFLPVQLETLPHLMAASPLPPRDVCVCAPTGCGKTLCYVVPIVTALLGCVVRQVRSVVVVPSRPLAQQVAKVFSQVAGHTRVRCGLLCGDTQIEREASLLADHTSFPAVSHVDIVIATPGRLAEHLSRGSFASLQFLRYLVMDEADKLLSQQIHTWLPQLLCTATPVEATPTSSSNLCGWLSTRSEHTYDYHFPPSPPSSWQRTARHSLMCAHQLSSSERECHIQKLLLSATMTQDPEALAVLQLHRPLLFSVAVPRAGRELMSLAPPPSLKEAAVICSPHLKPLVLLFLLSREMGRSGSALCFTNSRDTSQRLKVVLEHFNLFKVAMVTSEVSFNERRRALGQFARGEVKVLVCSDALTRGIDLPDCGCVISYDPPARYHTYLHRVGRTARAGCAGNTFSLLCGEEVAKFRRMLRVARRPRIEEEEVTADTLQPLRTEYELALECLRDTVVNS